MNEPPSGSRPVIRLDGLTKQFGGADTVAVDHLSMDIGAGEFVMLVGPSGCGKTTTLRLINRLIEPTSGRIFLEGNDVTGVNPDELRRHIGYVIQQVGLFPHMTIGANIALTPKLLGWSKSRIQQRVGELLDLVGLEPGAYRGRYPRQLSGGQQQRVGVARALTADPPVMLMDEPFGAIDPITRERLQDEFLNLQAQLHKTIVFVTHDIQEAIKMGTRIALFREHGRLEQYDTPREILAHPATEFVAQFVGVGSSVRLLGLTTVGEADVAHCRVDRDGAVAEGDPGVLPGRILHLDGSGHPLNWSVDGVDRARPSVLLRRDETLYQALDRMLQAREPAGVVVDEAGAYLGIIPLDALSTSIPQHRTAGASVAATPGEAVTPS